MIPISEQQSQSLSAPVQSQQLLGRIWIQLPPGDAVRIPIKDCEIVDDLKEVIKNKLSPDLNDVPVHKINLYTSSDQNVQSLFPDELLSEVLSLHHPVGSNARQPFYVRIIQTEKPMSTGKLMQSIQ